MMDIKHEILGIEIGCKLKCKDDHVWTYEGSLLVGSSVYHHFIADHTAKYFWKHVWRYRAVYKETILKKFTIIED